MADWRISLDVDSARRLFSEVAGASTSAAERIAAKVALAMHQEAVDAFSRQAEPRTGRPWAPAAQATQDDPRFVALGRRQGLIEAAIRTGWAKVPMGARAFLNVDSSAQYPERRGYGRARSVWLVASVFLWGRKAGGSSRSSRARARRRQANANKYANWAAMPGRRFFGLAGATVREIVSEYEETVVRAAK